MEAIESLRLQVDQLERALDDGATREVLRIAKLMIDNLRIRMRIWQQRKR